MGILYRAPTFVFMNHDNSMDVVWHDQKTSTSVFGKCSGIMCQHSSTTCPKALSCISPPTISPNRNSRQSANDRTLSAVWNVCPDVLRCPWFSFYPKASLPRSDFSFFCGVKVTSDSLIRTKHSRFSSFWLWLKCSTFFRKSYWRFWSCHIRCDKKDRSPYHIPEIRRRCLPGNY